MPKLFPTNEENSTNETQDTQVKFGRSWRFDFNKGDFVLTPTGKVAESEDVDSWLEWCHKAIQTSRYRFMAYSHNYGQEFENLIAKQLTGEGNESEIKRIVTETLMVNPRTKRVDNFTFDWDGDRVYFSCDIYNIRDESATLNESVVIN
nr:hypothetical protein 7 [bacterium]BDD46358.1 hypothetical protein 4 [Pelagibacterales bacterium]